MLVILLMEYSPNLCILVLLTPPWALLLFLSARDLRIVRTDPAGNIKADKEKSTEKIDGAVATIMGLDRAIRCGNNTGASVYDDRGILFI